MSFQHACGATVVVFVFGVVAVGPAYAQRRDGGLLPQEQEGQVAAVGCLLRGSAVRGGKKDKYVLARPRSGPVFSVPEATCTADAGADALDLDNTSKAGVNDALLGRWVEISGKLEKETSKDPDELRELAVAAFKLVPVVAPAPEAALVPAAAAPAPVAAAPPAADPAPASAAPPAAAPAAVTAPASETTTSGEETSSTGSSWLLIGGLGVVLIAVVVFLTTRRQQDS
jgi:LPXTG-motif cell wall-anchored protein